MVIELNPTPSIFDRTWRLEENQNWDILMSIFREGIDKTMSTEAIRQIIDTWLQDNEFKPKEAVATFADLPQNAELKELRGVLDENAVYVFDGAQWLKQSNINFDGLAEFKALVENNLNSRGVLATAPPEGYTACVGDGVTDDYAALQALINAFSYVILPPLNYRVSNELRLGRNGKQLIGLTETVRGYSKTAVLIYDGPVDNKKAVVLMGTNKVGEEPTIDCTNNQLKNVFIDCNYKAGFGVYGTYLTNETEVVNVTVKGSLEHNFYFARGWYGSLQKLTSLNCKNAGITIGAPLVYADGTKVNWTTENALEINNMFIRDLRSVFSGEQYSVDKPNTFNPNINYATGYGVCIGHGNALNVDNITSEKSGGVNLYCLTGIQPVKSIENMYMEKPCLNGGLAATDAVHMFIENESSQGSMYEIKDIYMSLEGGIMYKGSTRKVKLVNVYNPSFLKSWNNEYDTNTLYSIVIKDNVSYNCGYHNFDEGEFVQVYRGTNDTRYSFTVPFLENKRKFRVVYVKLKTSSAKAIGSMVWRKADGTYQTKNYPTDINANTFVFSHIQSGSYVNFEKGGVTEAVDGNVEFLIYEIPSTWT